VVGDIVNGSFGDGLTGWRIVSGAGFRNQPVQAARIGAQDVLIDGSPLVTLGGDYWHTNAFAGADSKQHVVLGPDPHNPAGQKERPGPVLHDAAGTSKTVAQGLQYVMELLEMPVGLGTDWNILLGGPGPRFGPMAIPGLSGETGAKDDWTDWFRKKRLDDATNQTHAVAYDPPLREAAALDGRPAPRLRLQPRRPRPLRDAARHAEGHEERGPPGGSVHRVLRLSRTLHPGVGAVRRAGPDHAAPADPRAAPRRLAPMPSWYVHMQAAAQTMQTLKDKLPAGSPLTQQQADAYDVWVHAWNLSQSQVSGARVRVRVVPSPFNLGAAGVQFQGFLGGTAIDLGDRLSERAHRVVKIASFTAPSLGGGLGIIASYSATLIATVDALSDPSSGALSPGADRHTAHLAVIGIRRNRGRPKLSGDSSAAIAISCAVRDPGTATPTGMENPQGAKID
jgi:hypothetical protein